jgi:hypothetical protein
MSNSNLNFQSLYEEHAKAIYRLSYRLLGNHEEAKDLTHDALEFLEPQTVIVLNLAVMEITKTSTETLATSVKKINDGHPGTFIRWGNSGGRKRECHQDEMRRRIFRVDLS